MLSLDEAIRLTTQTRETWSEFDSDEDPDAEYFGGEPITVERPTDAGSVVRTWLPEYLCIGNDGVAGGLFVDQRPGTLTGCVRMWDKTEADDDYGTGPIATS